MSECQSKKARSAFKAVLITQCIQKDYLMPDDVRVKAGRIFIGHDEARRLVGRDVTRGPLAQCIQWARQRDDIKIIHIRDWHNVERDQAHLLQFGPHCIEGTEGADLVVGMPFLQAKEEDVDVWNKEVVINGSNLNDVEHTTLVSHLACVDPSVTRVAVLGLWTDVKVSFLLYDLSCRLKFAHLATSSALTASNDVEAHHAALKRLRNVLNVNVFGGVSDLLLWLSNDSTLSRSATVAGIGEGSSLSQMALPVVELNDANKTVKSLRPSEIQLVRSVYSNCTRVVLSEITNGFSGAKVMRVSSFAEDQVEEFPTLVKFDKRDNVVRERVNCERVQSVLGNNAPRVLGFSDFTDEPIGILKFAFAGLVSLDPNPVVRHFRDVYLNGSTEDSINIVKTLFGAMLRRLLQQARYVPYDIFAAYDFDGKGWSWAKGGTDVPEKVTERIRDLLPGQENLDRLDFFGVESIPNGLAEFLRTTLPRLAADYKDDYHLTCVVHGDLHFDNVLLDSNQNVFLIDFQYTRVGPLLKDFCKLEADLLHIHTRLDSTEDLKRALELSKALNSVSDCLDPLPEKHFGVAKFDKAWGVISELRRQIAKASNGHRSTAALAIARLRYALHALTFDFVPPLNRIWALYDATSFALNLAGRKRYQGQNKTYELFPIESNLFTSYLPGRIDRKSTLDEDIKMLVERKVTLVVIAATQSELDWAHGRQELHVRLKDHGIRSLHLAGLATPSLAALESVVSASLEDIRSGGKVLICSMGGLGRAALVSGAIMKRLHPQMTVDQILLHIQRVRGIGRCVLESSEQQSLLERF